MLDKNTAGAAAAATPTTTTSTSSSNTVNESKPSTNNVENRISIITNSTLTNLNSNNEFMTTSTQGTSAATAILLAAASQRTSQTNPNTNTTAASTTTTTLRETQRSIAYYIQFPYDVTPAPTRRHYRTKSLGAPTFMLPQSLQLKIEYRLSQLKTLQATHAVMAEAFDAAFPVSPVSPVHGKQPGWSWAQEDTKRVHRISLDSHTASQHRYTYQTPLFLQLQAKHYRASLRRAAQLASRRARLVRHHQRHSHTTQIHKQQERVRSLHLKNKTDFAMTNAYLKRQLILQRHVQRCGADVERAQGIAMLQRLEKKMAMRRSYSTSFAETMKEEEHYLNGQGNMTQNQQQNVKEQRWQLSPTSTTVSQASQMMKSSLDAQSQRREALAHAAIAVTQAVAPSATSSSTAKSTKTTSPQESVPPSLGKPKRKLPSPLSLQMTDQLAAMQLSPVKASFPMNIALSPVSDTSDLSSGIDRSLGREAMHIPSTPSSQTTTPSPVQSPTGRTSIQSAFDVKSTLKRSASMPLVSSSSGRSGPKSLQSMISDTLRQIELENLAGSTADMMPPINRYTLRELDFDEIVNNVQLRHDLYFDAELQFKPNDDGERGTLKAQKTEAFWKRVEDSVTRMKSFREAAATNRLQDFDRSEFLRVPVLINEIKEIMFELLPYSAQFHEELKAHLDVDLIAQQLEYSQLNAVPLIEYIAATLKTHCAPIRDELIDKMAATCRQGHFAETLRMIFDILELMKLDIANHQLRKLRPYVVENAVTFEWEFFSRQIQSGSCTTARTESWFREAYFGPDPFRLSQTAPPSAALNINGNGMTRSSSQHALVTDLKAASMGTLQRSVSVPLLATGQGSTTPSIVPPSAVMTPNASNTNSGLTKSYFTEVFYKALLSLIVSPRVLDSNQLPETLSLDTVRLGTFHNDWQDITIMACLLILFRQAAGAKCTPDHCKETKNQLWVLLNDVDTTLPHVTLQLLNLAEKVRGKAFTEQEKIVLSNTIDKTLSPESTLYELIHNRVAVHLFVFMRDGQLPMDLIVKHGLTELVEDVKSLAERVSALAEHNRLVFAPLYNEISKALQEEDATKKAKASAAD